jgi:hypothetical protein
MRFFSTSLYEETIAGIVPKTLPQIIQLLPPFLHCLPLVIAVLLQCQIFNKLHNENKIRKTEKDSYGACMDKPTPMYGMLEMRKCLSRTGNR